MSTSDLYESNNGYLPFCKACALRHYAEHLVPACDGDERKAVKAMCASTDWFYSDAAYNMSDNCRHSDGGNESEDTSVFSIYAGKRLLRQVKAYGKTFSDTLMRETLEEKRLQDERIRQSYGGVDPDRPDDVPDPKAVEMFGPGFTYPEYAYMLGEYEEWRSRYEINTKALEVCVQTLCVAQLNIRKAQQGGDIKDVQNAMKTFQDMLATAKLSPKQSKEESIGDSETFGNLIKIWEDGKPIPECDPEYKDVDGLKKNIEVFFLGHLAKLFHLHNDISAVYDEEIEKYTVSPPVYDDDNSDDAVLDMFDKNKEKSESDGD